MFKVSLVFIAIFVGLTVQRTWAQSARAIWVAYSCEASDIIEFTSGDRKIQTLASQVQWVLKEPDSVNLVVGAHHFLLRPHIGKSQGSFEISLMQKFFGEGYRTIETKELSSNETAITMQYRNSYSKEVLVKCIVSANIP